MKHQTKLNNKSPIERIILLSFPILFSFTLLSALVLLNSHASADDTKSATASVNVASACTMTSSGESSHTATATPGVFLGNIGTTTITTTCNNHPGGYAIYAIGYSDSTYGNTNLINSTDTSTTIPTGTGTAGSNWSMKLAPGTGTQTTDIVAAYRDYTNVPSTFTKVVNKNSATSPTTGSTVTTTYGTYVTPTQRPGTYNGKVKYIMTNPSTSEALFYMQDVDQIKAALKNASVGTELTVKDKRDNKEYTVAKMADGNIWMNQNLDLCIGCNGTAALTSENTDLNESGTGIYTEGYSNSGGVITWAPNSTTTTGTPATITNFAPGSPADSVTGWTNSNIIPQMAEGGDHWLANNRAYSDKTDCISAQSIEECKHKHVGDYYNWTAAVASNNSATQSARYETAANSICPKGWRLPKGPDGTNGSEFNILLSQAGIAAGVDPGSGEHIDVGFMLGGLVKMESDPYYFGHFGGVSGNIFYYLTQNGNYWSGSVVHNSNAFFLNYLHSTLRPANQGTRSMGKSLRCLAR